MDRLDVQSKDAARAQIENEDQARNWVTSLVQDMLKARLKCDIPIPDRSEMSVKKHQRRMWSFLTKQGKVVGALQTLLKCGVISEAFYQEMHQRALNTLVPTNVGKA